MATTPTQATKAEARAELKRTEQRTEQQRIDAGLRNYLVAVAIFYGFMGVSLIFAPATNAVTRLARLTPFANTLVIGWSFAIMGAVLYQTLIRPDWLGFRRLTIILLMAHSIGYIGLSILISLQTGMDWSRPFGWGYITAIHLIAINTAYNARNPFSRSELHVTWGEVRTAATRLVKKVRARNG